MKYKLFFLSIAIVMVSCAQKTDDTIKDEKLMEVKEYSDAAFNDVWYQGKASVAVYRLTQSRYGQSREGYASLITVTEGFDGDKQVKSDNDSQRDYGVLKTNFIKKFNTGLYDYATMVSAFVPVNTKELQMPTKLTFGSQDWCGQVFNQWNASKDMYTMQAFSYFHSEGDTEESLPKALTQDALFASIRMNPSQLPRGKVEMYLSNENYRFLHVPVKTYSSEASMEVRGEKMVYTVSNAMLTLEYEFASSQPYTIFSFKETYNKGSLKGQVTQGVLEKESFRAYWNENSKDYDSVRKEMNLPFFGLNNYTQND